MNARRVIYLAAISILALSYGTAYAVTKIAPTEGEVGHPLLSAEGGVQDASMEEQSDSSSCMDEYFTKLELGGLLVPLDPAGNWELAMEPSTVSDRITFLACLPSSPVAEARPGGVSPSLFLICGIDVADAVVIVVADYRVRSKASVIMRFDDTEPEMRNWKLSPDEKAIIAPETSGEFAKELMMHDLLSVQLTLRNKQVLEFTYDLRGASESLNTLREVCNWPN